MQVILAKWKEADKNEQYTMFFVEYTDKENCFYALDALADPYTACYKVIEDPSILFECGLEELNQDIMKQMWHEFSDHRTKNFNKLSLSKLYPPAKDPDAEP